MKKAVLFDFDGVIADTEMKTLAYTEELFFKYGAVLSMEEKISYIGTDGKEPTRKLLEKSVKQQRNFWKKEGHLVMYMRTVRI